MNCEEFQNLLPQEKIDYVGKLVHAVQSSSLFFEAGQRIIKKAAKSGIFSGVAISPPDWANVPPDETVTEISEPLKPNEIA